MSDATSYMTYEGYQRLSQEASDLWRNRRPAVVKAISEAAAEGDRSENAEYIYRKKELRELDRKIRWLEAQLKKAKVVRDKPKIREKIFFGASVTLLQVHDSNNECTYRIVGSAEARTECKEISYLSPFAQMLLGKHLGDEVEFQTQDGTKCVYEILAIHYE